MADPIQKMNVADIIQQAYEKKPMGVEDAFNDVIQQKMADAISARRSAIEDEMAGREPEEELETDHEDDITDEDFDEDV